MIPEVVDIGGFITVFFGGFFSVLVIIIGGYFAMLIVKKGLKWAGQFSNKSNEPWYFNSFDKQFKNNDSLFHHELNARDFRGDGDSYNRQLREWGKFRGKL